MVIEAALRDSVVTTLDKDRDRVENHYRRHGERYLVKVCVIGRPAPIGSIGEVVTAHLVPRVGRKEQPGWP